MVANLVALALRPATPALSEEEMDIVAAFLVLRPSIVQTMQRSILMTG
jgi:hypothetical protein